jgi:hypothetical protein
MVRNRSRHRLSRLFCAALTSASWFSRSGCETMDKARSRPRGALLCTVRSTNLSKARVERRNMSSHNLLQRFDRYETPLFQISLGLIVVGPINKRPNGRFVFCIDGAIKLCNTRYPCWTNDKGCLTYYNDVKIPYSFKCLSARRQDCFACQIPSNGYDLVPAQTISANITFSQLRIFEGSANPAMKLWHDSTQH